MKKKMPDKSRRNLNQFSFPFSCFLFSVPTNVLYLAQERKNQEKNLYVVTFPGAKKCDNFKRKLKSEVKKKNMG